MCAPQYRRFFFFLIEFWVAQFESYWGKFIHPVCTFTKVRVSIDLLEIKMITTIRHQFCRAVKSMSTKQTQRDGHSTWSRRAPFSLMYSATKSGSGCENVFRVTLSPNDKSSQVNGLFLRHLISHMVKRSKFSRILKQYASFFLRSRKPALTFYGIVSDLMMPFNGDLKHCKTINIQVDRNRKYPIRLLFCCVL